LKDTTTTTAAPITTTTAAPVTTTTVAPVTVLNFTLSQNDTSKTCFKMLISLSMNFSYVADKTVNGTEYNTTVAIDLNNYDTFEGQCADSFDTLTIKFLENWSLTFNYTLDKDEYELSKLSLNYVVDDKNFPNVKDSEKGPRTAMLSNLTEFSALKGNSFKCTAKTEIKLNDKVVVDISNYRAQPFMNKDKSSDDFDTGFFFYFIFFFV
jgi:hypothetical protein